MKEPRIRVAGILKETDNILFVKHRKNNEEYYLLPGGGVEFGETFEEALLREFMEEVNLEVKIEGLYFISEAIDPNGEKHIINFIFEVSYVSGIIKIPEEERIVGVEYLNIKDLNKYTIYPNIKNYLTNLENGNIKYLGNIWE